MERACYIEIMEGLTWILTASLPSKAVTLWTDRGQKAAISSQKAATVLTILVNTFLKTSYSTSSVAQHKLNGHMQVHLPAKTACSRHACVHMISKMKMRWQAVKGYSWLDVYVLMSSSLFNFVAAVAWWDDLCPLTSVLIEQGTA